MVERDPGTRLYSMTPDHDTRGTRPPQTRTAAHHGSSQHKTATLRHVWSSAHAPPVLAAVSHERQSAVHRTGEARSRSVGARARVQGEHRRSAPPLPSRTPANAPTGTPAACPPRPFSRIPRASPSGASLSPNSQQWPPPTQSGSGALTRGTATPFANMAIPPTTLRAWPRRARPRPTEAGGTARCVNRTAHPPLGGCMPPCEHTARCRP